MTQAYDIVIVGSGLVGASLACALQHLPLRIAIIEAVASKQRLTTDFDARSIALNYGSQRIFSSIGLWPELAAHAEPIEQVHVSDQGHFGMTRFTAKQQGKAALGYLVELQALSKTLDTALQKMAQLDSYCPATLEQIDYRDGINHLQLQTEQGVQQLQCKLLVAADGARSTVRDLLQIKTQSYDYKQQAIVANIGLQRDHHYTAYERFTKTGPIAMLPMANKRCAMIWTVPPEQVKAVMMLDDQPFLQQLQQQFGYRLGRLIKVGKRQHFPLILTTAEDDHASGAVLIGNAAHSLHPIAGQGFNLGLRDVSVLAQQINAHFVSDNALPVTAIIDAYSLWQSRDQKRMTRFTDVIAKLFSNSNKPLSLLRNVGLLSMDFLPVLRDQFAKHSMGMAGKLSDLSCGLPLATTDEVVIHE